MNLCTVSGVLRRANGQPAAFRCIEFIPAADAGTANLLADGESVPWERLFTTTDRDGAFTIDLACGACFDVRIDGARDVYPYLVPEDADANLFDGLFPRPVDVRWVVVTIDEDAGNTYDDPDYVAANTIEIAVDVPVYLALEVRYTHGGTTYLPLETVTHLGDGSWTLEESEIGAFQAAAPGSATLTPNQGPWSTNLTEAAIQILDRPGVVDAPPVLTVNILA